MHIIWIGSKKFSDQVYHHTRWKLDWGSTTFNALGIQFSVDLHNIVDINYNLLIPKIIAMVQQWKRRVLTPIGRITVIKSLLIPKLNHLFISLPNPKKETISYLNKTIFEFLWKSKIDKVKRSVITQDYSSGGLKMVDINNFITSLKCSWIKRLTKAHKPWMDFLFTIYGNDFLQKLFDFGDSFVIECLHKVNNVFWKDVLNSWLCFITTYKNHPKVKDNFLNTPVWYNSNIHIANKYVFIKAWYKTGVKVIQDFYDENCNFLDIEEFKCKYSLKVLCTMQYNSVKTAIFKFFKMSNIDRTSVKRNPNPCIPFFFQTVIPHEKCTKIIYNVLNENVVVPIAVTKWKTYLTDYNVKYLTVYDILKICFKTVHQS